MEGTWIGLPCGRLRSVPLISATTRSYAMSRFAFSLSMLFLLWIRVAMQLLPTLANGSITVSPSLVRANISRSTSSIGDCGVWVVF